MRTGGRLLLVDLNNFAYYPSIAIGYLTAVLRRAGYRVDILSPLAYGVPSGVREKKEGLLDHLERRISFSTHGWIEKPRFGLGRARTWWRARTGRYVDTEFRRRLADDPPDLILISTYTDSYSLCVDLAGVARERSIPVLIGGPVFNHPSVAEEWTSIPGVVGIVGAEAEGTIADMVGDILGGRDVAQYPGFFSPDGRRGRPASPLRTVNELPYPDYDDFPWHLYPHRIVPVLSARGCGWARCTFCTDITTASGRGYRSRSADDVLGEVESQSQKYGAKNVTFLDIKLNSNLEMWHAIREHLPRRVPGAKWICSVHVGTDGPNGLTGKELAAAAKAGLTRVTFGVESGSQRVLNLMDKGTNVDANREFTRLASEAGISVRCTTFHGYPGEEASDLEKTAEFLEAQAPYLDRVRVNPFNVRPGSRFAVDYKKSPESFPGLRNLNWEYRFARSTYRYTPARTNAYRHAMRRYLNAVYAVNRKPLRETAREFDGVM
jgi:radical SAM superfamily enzyme YgiQ (UPF0313 family)